MKSITPIGLRLASTLIDFSGDNPAAASFADQQLQGAVALHNMLAEERFAYIADEVGMGKTYVALGAVALMRHFHPDLRVLYLVPKENLQRKWQKEIHNFATNNWQLTDHRVRSFDGRSAREVIECGNLLEFIHNAAINANRDFLLRMSSFSFGLSDKDERAQRKWAEYRDEVLHELSWLSPCYFDLRNKAAFKDSIARAVNAVMPHFDLVVVDEAHNLKHGFGASGQVSARNRMLALSLGHPDPDAGLFTGGGVKADRVLALSATPIETSFQELWNQMDVVGLGHLCSDLCDGSRDDADKKQAARRFLVRRVMSLTIDNLPHTKNMYRREWRGGGVHSHDEPMRPAGVAQRLVIALVQKKVAEVLEKTGRKANGYFSRSYQMGMLSSFESFLQTAKVDDATFDQEEQGRTIAERDGIDTPSLQKIIRSYEATFGCPMPHPKMDEVAEHLWQWMLRGEKTLVFVRRIASVNELQDKVAEHYDKWLRAYLLSKLSNNAPVSRQLERCFQEYSDAWENRRSRKQGVSSAASSIVNQSGDQEKDDGGADNFFAWFFRGEGPEGIVSGAHFRKIRLGGEGTTLSTFFEDNYVQLILNLDPDSRSVFAAWRDTCPDISPEQLRQRAFSLFMRSSAQKRFPRRRVFHAYQAAALRFMAETDAQHSEKARIVVEERYPLDSAVGHGVPANFPQPDDFLDTRTFFTELSRRIELAAELQWKAHESEADFLQYFLQRERRRELLTSIATLGHPIIDLWCLAVSHLPSLSRGAADRSEQSAELLASEFLDLLDSQKECPFSSCRELVQASRNFRLIANVNFPNLDCHKVAELPGFYRASLQRQTPVGGMWGQFNQQLVTQFRMPGYPYVLITTDVVQEGEDLHPFCSRVVHYGITWTPSSMEQRTGRVDRIGSLIHRKLDGASGVTEEELLQVFFPYLADTVEIVQVREIFRRMNRFLNLMHEPMQASAGGEPTVDVSAGILSAASPIPASHDPLRTSFEIPPRHLIGTDDRRVFETNRDEYVQELNTLLDQLQALMPVTMLGSSGTHRSGTVTLPAVEPDASDVNAHTQNHHFELQLRTGKRGCVLLTVRSPVVGFDPSDVAQVSALFAAHQRFGKGKLSAIWDNEDLTLFGEMNILFIPSTTRASQIAKAIETVVSCALNLTAHVENEDAYAAHS